MRIREFGATPSGCQNWSPTRPSNPGEKSSTALKERKVSPGPEGWNPALRGRILRGFRAEVEG